MRKNGLFPLSPAASLKVADRQVNYLCLDLQEPVDPGILMEAPVIAFDLRSIVSGELGGDYGDMTVIALPTFDLTEGRLRHVTPHQLGMLLFDEDVGEEVVLTLSLAMVLSQCIQHAEVRDRVDELVEDVKACVSRNILKCVQPAAAL